MDTVKSLRHSELLLTILLDKIEELQWELESVGESGCFECAEKTQKIKDLYSSFDDMVKEISGLKEKNKDLKEKKEEYRISLNNTIVENNSYASEIEGLSGNAILLRADISKLKDRIAELEDESQHYSRR